MSKLSTFHLLPKIVFMTSRPTPHSQFDRLREHDESISQAHYLSVKDALYASDDWRPIYVGKAVPAGGRVGGVGLDTAPGNVLFNRLREHAESLNQARNLNREDFFCQYLLVDDIWIPLAESALIQTFQPVWNTTVYGFGNHDPGGGRYKQQRSPWDVIHPGRPWADRLQPNARTEAQIIDAIRLALAPK
jgi:hypothetical protein